MVKDPEDTQSLVDSALTTLEFLRDSGVSHIPVPPSAPAPDVSAPRPSTGAGPGHHADPAAGLAKVKDAIVGCTCRDDLAGVDAVAGEGAPDARVVFVGGFPDAVSAAEARPFSDQCEEGELLTGMIRAMKLERSRVYVTYAVKCAVGVAVPPEAMRTCPRHHLERELAAVSPDVVVALGRVAAKALLGSSDVPRLRGRFHERGPTVVMATYEPATLLKNNSLKRQAWHDLQMVMKRLSGRGA